MKTISILLLLFLGIQTTQASSQPTGNNKNSVKKTTPMKQELNREVNQHIFFPISESGNIAGNADVVFEVIEGGLVKVASISTSNQNIHDFILRQADKMSVKGEIREGQQFMYRFVFKRQA